ncbi:hypothetical protein GCM10027160_39560 [Streptomyces calidiresistens]|uniref:Hydrogenase expression protein HypF n=1 Tax=Streptomyces calidiresistens TaxID=1485586 RepID=A0A7W3T4K5_9ACTN|nr:hypothetical protein [Streptomyces calidiresistens]MBB0230850.1 hypothetical protein [Streptomyces calidiresistens]
MSGESPGVHPKRRGRHARPRTRTAALVAMPSVLMLGMGLTPGVARADPTVDSPFREGPCVEMSDPAEAGEPPADGADPDPAEPDPAEPGAGNDTADGTGDERTPDTDDTGPAETGPPPARTAGRGGDGDGPAAGAPTGDVLSPPPGPTAPPQPDTVPAGEGSGESATDPVPGPGRAGNTGEAGDTAETDEDAPALRDRLDPLGIGDALRGIGEGLSDLVTGGSRSTGTDGTEPTGAPGPVEEGSGADAPPTTPEEAGGAVGDGAPGGGPAARPAPTGPPSDGPSTGTTGGSGSGGAGEPAGEASTEPGDAPDAGTDAGGRDVGGEDAAEDDPFAPDAGGKVPFPCPETVRRAGTDEVTPVVVADRPWLLDARSLTLNGLKYHGVVNLTTANGSTKQALKFTADRLDIGDLHQIVQAPDGLNYHVQAARGSNSTFRNGRVTMYTERLEGRLFGLIPIVFDPLHEPPLDLPFAHFTDVLVTQAGQFGGELTIPGMRQYTTRR